MKINNILKSRNDFHINVVYSDAPLKAVSCDISTIIKEPALQDYLAQHPDKYHIITDAVTVDGRFPSFPRLANAIHRAGLETLWQPLTAAMKPARVNAAVTLMAKEATYAECTLAWLHAIDTASINFTSATKAAYDGKNHAFVALEKPRELLAKNFVSWVTLYDIEVIHSAMNAMSPDMQQKLLAEHGRECFIDACKNGNLHKVTYFQACAIGHDGMKQACGKGRMDVVQHLLASGVDIHADDDIALRTACKYGHLDIVTHLLSTTDADVNAAHGEALQQACLNGDVPMVRYLLSEGANIHESNDAALRCACANGCVDVMDYLLTSPELHDHADIYTHDSECEGKGYLLELANSHQRQASIAYLLSYGQYMADNLDCCERLLANRHLHPDTVLDAVAGFSDEQRSHLMQRAAQWVYENACSQGRLELVHEALSYNADIQHDNHKGFINACKYGHANIVNYLLTSPDLDIHADDDRAFLYATVLRNKDIVNTFLQHGQYMADRLPLCLEHVDEKLVLEAYLALSHDQKKSVLDNNPDHHTLLISQHIENGIPIPEIENTEIRHEMDIMI